MQLYTHPDLPGIHGDAAFVLGGVIVGVDVSAYVGLAVAGVVVDGDGIGAEVEIVHDESGALSGIEIRDGGRGYSTAVLEIEPVEDSGDEEEEQEEDEGEHGEEETLSWQVTMEIGAVRYPRAWWRTVSEGEIAALGFEPHAEPEPEPPTPEQVIESFRIAIQHYVDVTAQSRRYDSGNSLATYVASTNEQWAAEAAAFVAWRDAVWAYAYSELDKVLTGAREQPAVMDFLDELPPMVWPDQD